MPLGNNNKVTRERKAAIVIINFTSSKRVQTILTVLAICEEMPRGISKLLGNDVTYRRLINEMCEKQSYRNGEAGEVLECKALNVSGKGREKNVRLTRQGKELLRWLDYGKYSEAVERSNLSGRETNIERHHRIAEAVVMMHRAEIEYRPWKLIPLQTEIKSERIAKPSFYGSREFRGDMSHRAKRYTFTRIVGVVMTSKKVYTVYNTRERVMKWGGAGETRAKMYVGNFASQNTQSDTVYSTILMSTTLKNALDTVFESDRLTTRRSTYIGEAGMNRLYDNIHFVPLDDFGVKILRILVEDDFEEKLFRLIFDESERASIQDTFIYDAKSNGKYICSFLSGDINKLIRFKKGSAGIESSCAVLCYKEQLPSLKEYLGERYEYQTVEIDEVLRELTEKGVD